MNSATLPVEPGACQFPCDACGLELPLRGAIRGEKPTSWICVGCGGQHTAIYRDDAPRGIATNALRYHPPKQPAPEKPRTALADKPLAARKPPECSEQTLASATIDRELRDASNLQVQQQGPPLISSAHKPHATPYDPEVEAELTESCGAAVGQLDNLIATLESGRGIDRDAHPSIARNTLLQATKDLDLFVKLGVNPMNEDYPGGHSLHVAMLASAIGANMGWDEKTLVELGVGCLIHDIGMVMVPDKVYRQPHVLSDGDFSLIVAHPLRTFDLIEDHLSSVPLASRMVAYQVHERLDGKGYPRKRNKALIHQAARVAAIADVYIALVSTRPHREPLMPYHAVEHLLYATRMGQFDAEAVRALLKTVSLFPIGSCVRLSDDRVARVIRTSPTDYARPVLETWRAGELDAPAEIVDLTRSPEVGISKPIASLDAA